MLQKTISAIRAETWEAINRALLSDARQEKLEDGSFVRLDSTATAALMHEPSDSSLLWDAVRVMVRLLKAAGAWLGGIVRAWRDHRRAAKKRARAIQFTRGRPKRVQLYRQLIEITRATLAYLRSAAAQLVLVSNPAVELWQAEVRHYQPLVEQIIAQSRGEFWRRAGAGPRQAGQPVRAACRIASRQPRVDYGHSYDHRQTRLDPRPRPRRHPADRERLCNAKRHIALYGRPRERRPPMAAMPAEIISPAQSLRVRDMDFTRRAAHIEDMVKSRWSIEARTSAPHEADSTA